MLLDLVLPCRCAGCDRPGAALCATCDAAWRAPVPVPVGLPGYATARYEGSARKVVLAYKERGRRDLARPIGAALARTLAQVLPDGEVCLVPAPSRRGQARRRGGQHMLAVAGHCARELAAAGRPAAVAPALAVTAGVRDSVGLTASQRAINLRGRIRVAPAGAPAAGTEVVLVDDVVTTGATALACASALESVGLTVRAVLAYACVSHAGIADSPHE